MKCTHCSKLGHCKEALDAGAMAVVRGYGCVHFDQAPEPVIAARNRAALSMGLAAVVAFLDTPTETRRTRNGF